jgi:hypothetical protein
LNEPDVLPGCEALKRPVADREAMVLKLEERFGATAFVFHCAFASRHVERLPTAVQTR